MAHKAPGVIVLAGLALLVCLGIGIALLTDWTLGTTLVIEGAAVVLVGLFALAAGRARR
jgi:hypothetical protein